MMILADGYDFVLVLNSTTAADFLSVNGPRRDLDLTGFVQG